MSAPSQSQPTPQTLPPSPPTVNLRTHLESIFSEIDRDYKTIYYPKIQKFDDQITGKLNQCLKAKVSKNKDPSSVKAKCYEKYNVGSFDFVSILEGFEICVSGAFPVNGDSVRKIDQCYLGYKERMKESLMKLYQMTRLSE